MNATCGNVALVPDREEVPMHLFHRWVTVEQTGKVVVQRWSCGKTRVRVR